MSDTTPEPVVPAATPEVEQAAASTVVVEEKKKRGVGVWSFILGLLTVIADVAIIVFGIVTAVGIIGQLSSGEFEAAATALRAAGFGVLLVVAFFGGFVTAGLGALLGLIALITGRGRVIGLIGLILSAGALLIRILMLNGGLDIANLFG